MGFGCGLFSCIRDIFRKKRNSSKLSKLESEEPKPIVRVDPPRRVPLSEEVEPLKKVALPRKVASSCHKKVSGPQEDARFQVASTRGDIHIKYVTEQKIKLSTRTMKLRNEILFSPTVDEFEEIRNIMQGR
jgi:hypothetical protein